LLASGSRTPATSCGAAPPAEQLGKRPLALVGVEDVVLVDRDPGQRLALAGELVAPSRVFLLGLEQC
jgi:hypothetical protein